MSTELLGYSEAHWQAVAGQWANEFPDIHALAREQAAALLKRLGVPELEPDQVWWHRFDRANSSPHTYTGWEHSGRPVESLTLVELLMQRYAAKDQDSLDNLQVEGGFYRDGPAHGVFDERNEVRLLAVQVSEEFWNIDFAALYQRRLTNFWQRQGHNFMLLARLALRAAILAARQRRQLQVADLKLLQGLYDGTSSAAVHPFSLGAYQARDVLRVVGAGGRQILYVPGDSRAVQAFANLDELYQWLRESLADEAGRERLANHFSPISGEPGEPLADLHGLLLNIAGDAEHAYRPLLDQQPAAIDGDPWRWLREEAQKQMHEQARTLLTSNAHLRQQIWLRYLGAFISVGGALAPLGWPAALVVVGAGFVSFVMNLDKAVQASTAQERREGIRGAIISAVAMVFNAPMLFEARTPLGEELAQVPELTELATGDVEAQWRPLNVLPTLPAHSQVNALGLLQRSDIAVLYHVEPLPRGTSPAGLAERLQPTPHFAQAPRMLDEPALRTFASASGAAQFAKAEFDGPFVMLEIDSQGLTAVAFRENVLHNPAALLRHCALAPDALQHQVLDEVAGGAWLFDEVHLATDGLDPSHCLPVAAEEVERLSANLPELAGQADPSGVLRGVYIAPPGFGRYLTDYYIEFGGFQHPVRYDPLGDCWRTEAGRGFRFDEVQGRFVEWPDVAGALQRPAMDIDRAVQQLGIEASWPWDLAPLSDAGGLPIPRKLHCVWLGKQLPRQFVKRVIHNAEAAGQGPNPFDTHLYLHIEDPAELESTLLRLAAGPARLKVHMLEQTPFFEAFRQTRYYAQYRAAASGPAVNYASAVDVLRYRLLHSEGGVYMDVDDWIESSGDGRGNFADGEFKVQPGQLLLNNLVFFRRLQMLLDFNTSNFGSLPDNPLLEQISAESYRRFLANPALYETRPYDYLHTAAQMDAYGRQISHTTGPGVFNDVIARQLPAWRQFRGLSRIARGGLYLRPAAREALLAQLRERARHYSALGGLIRIGTTGSWLYT